MSVRVRRLEARDKPVWLTLFKGYIEFYKATVPEDVIETTWQRLMQGDPDCHIGWSPSMTADKPIGLAHVLFHRSTWSTDLVLLPGGSVRRSGAAPSGAGRALIEAVYARGRCARLRRGPTG